MGGVLLLPGWLLWWVPSLLGTVPDSPVDAGQRPALPIRATAGCRIRRAPRWRHTPAAAPQSVALPPWHAAAFRCRVPAPRCLRRAAGAAHWPGTARPVRARHAVRTVHPALPMPVLRRHWRSPHAGTRRRHPTAAAPVLRGPAPGAARPSRHARCASVAGSSSQRWSSACSSASSAGSSQFRATARLA
ncbi:hypothetical protein G6F50_014975 [Rhizopus delemar]|uniref:Secreted protein n=1 Tax=Rhizopus delemar TaxID=936053 RepID=A0A9P6Y0V2_9FUNG|nr:hypothetical protein G6F50_014975 [Rhizopus delemar]